MASRGPSARRQRLSAPDWIDAALKVIAENGVEAVAVEPLAQRLGVTKGSFYAHFSSRNALVVAALEQWKSDETACTSSLLVGDDPLVVLSTLIGSMFGDHQRGKVYAGICAAGADPLVTPYALDHALAKVQILTDLYGSYAGRSLGLLNEADFPDAHGAYYDDLDDGRALAEDEQF